ncbi:MAG TPA: MFS transporter, partial [Jatrophihabitans sp.]|nr:MFS transporter [Jatrophihabitans sp.]
MSTRTAQRPRRLTAALAIAAFRRLLAVRLAGQFGDGVFQAGLAGAVLFNPERQAHAADIAAGFTVLLLPYSLVGPFAGVLLDRWWRQRVLVIANLVRAVAVVGVAAEIALGLGGLPFYTSALVVISISRFILSALSAAQPLLVADDLLVTANALAVTAGTLAATAGAGLAIGIRSLLGDTNGDYAVIALSAAIPYLVAAALAARFHRADLGPTHAQRQTRETAAQVLRGLIAGIRLIGSVRPVATAYAAITVHRICFGVWTVCAVLLYRNYLTAAGPFRAGLGGLAQVLAAVALGGGFAAFVTPAAFRRLGPVRWPAAMLATSAVLEIGLVLPYRPGLLVLSGLL